LNDEVVVTEGEGEAAAEEAKPKIDFVKSWFDQAWDGPFEMQWKTRTEGAAYEPASVSTRAPSSVW